MLPVFGRRVDLFYEQDAKRLEARKMLDCLKGGSHAFRAVPSVRCIREQPRTYFSHENPCERYARQYTCKRQARKPYKSVRGWVWLQNTKFPGERC